MTKLIVAFRNFAYAPKDTHPQYIVLRNVGDLYSFYCRVHTSMIRLTWKFVSVVNLYEEGHVSACESYSWEL
jgi:hypothetical protein